MLTKGKFAIHPDAGPQETFAGVHDVSQRWHQRWVTPRFTRPQINRIMRWLQASGDDNTERLRWDGDILVHDPGIELTGDPDIDEPCWQPVQLHPDRRGRYKLGGCRWTWQEVSPRRRTPANQSRAAASGGRHTRDTMTTTGSPRPYATGLPGSIGDCAAAQDPTPTPAAATGSRWALDHLTLRCGHREIVLRPAGPGHDLLEGGQFLQPIPGPQLPSPDQLTRLLPPLPRRHHLEQLLTLIPAGPAIDEMMRQIREGTRECPRYAVIVQGRTPAVTGLHEQVDEAISTLRGSLHGQDGSSGAIRDLDDDHPAPIPLWAPMGPADAGNAGPPVRDTAATADAPASQERAQQAHPVAELPDAESPSAQPPTGTSRKRRHRAGRGRRRQGPARTGPGPASTAVQAAGSLTIRR